MAEPQPPLARNADAAWGIELRSGSWLVSLEAEDGGSEQDAKRYATHDAARAAIQANPWISFAGGMVRPLPPLTVEKVDHIRPKHYKPDDIYEPLKVMLAQHGRDAVVSFCWLTAEKYLARAGKKDGEPIARDFRKAAFYLTHAADLLEKP